MRNRGLLVVLWAMGSVGGIVVVHGHGAFPLLSVVVVIFRVLVVVSKVRRVDRRA